MPLKKDIQDQMSKYATNGANFSDLGELLGKITQVKLKARRVISNNSSILSKNFKTLALIVTEEMRGQNRPLKSD